MAKLLSAIIKILKKILLIILIIVGIPVVTALSGAVFLMVSEYKPVVFEDAVPVFLAAPEGEEPAEESASPSPSAGAEGEDSQEVEPAQLLPEGLVLEAGATVRIMSMNVGGGSQGKDADLFLFGGTGVRPGSQSVTERNLLGIAELLASEGADMYLLQEVDEKSKRSFNINEIEYFSTKLKMTGAYAANNVVKYLPYPFPTYGAISSGLLTLSEYGASKIERIGLMKPFEWPLRVLAPKRCLLVTRIPVGDTSDELVVINLQFEALRPESAHDMLRELVSFMRSEYEAGNYVIAGGDFAALFPGAGNDKYPLYTDSSFMPVTLEPSALVRGLDFAFDDSIATMRLLDMPFDSENTEHQFFVTDGFIVSGNLKINGLRAVDGGFEFASHNPVIINVSLIK